MREKCNEEKAGKVNAGRIVVAKKLYNDRLANSWINNLTTEGNLPYHRYECNIQAAIEDS